MRPIDKGPWPLDEDGNKLIVTGYGEFKPYLLKRTGHYCHFCELPILNVPAVEHIKPKSPEGSPDRYKNLRTHWNNLLLICQYCNSSKGDRIVNMNNFYWPHIHNTFMLFEYFAEGTPSVRNSEPYIRGKAEATLWLYGLRKTTDSNGGPDTRLKKRWEAITKAIRLRNEYPNKSTAGAVADMAASTGFWSIWMEIFHDCPEVKVAILAHPDFGSGDIRHLFPPPSHDASPRNPSNLTDPT